LRTQAAAAAIQFTVDKEALKIDDATIAKVSKKRSVPKPMGEINGKETPVKASVIVTGIETNGTHASTDVVNGVKGSNGVNGINGIHGKPAINGSPAIHPALRAIATHGIASPEETPSSPAMLATDVEEKEDLDTEREQDIYNSKVIACSLERPEDCEMCSG